MQKYISLLLKSQLTQQIEPDHKTTFLIRISTELVICHVHIALQAECSTSN